VYFLSKHKLLYLSTVFLLLKCTALCAIDSKVIAIKGLPQLSINTELQYAITDGNDLNIPPDDNQFNIGNQFNFYQNIIESDKKCNWLQLELINSEPNNLKAILKLNMYGEVFIYKRLSNKRWQQIHKGGILNMKLVQPDFTEAISLDLVSGSNKLLIGFNNNGFFQRPFNLTFFNQSDFESQRLAFNDQNKINFIIQLVCFSILFFQFIYLLFQYFIIQKGEYVLYLVYLLFISLHFLSEAEFSLDIHLLFGLWPLSYIYLMHLLPWIAIAVYLQFIKYFGDLEKIDMSLFRFISYCQVFMIIYLTVDTVFLISTKWFITIDLTFRYMSFVLIAMVAFIIFRLYKLHSTLHSLVGVGLLCLTIGGMVSVLLYNSYNNNIFQTRLHPISWFEFGALAELFCFSTALAYKNRINSKEIFEEREAKIVALENRHQTQIKYYEVRDRIARDLHDEIGSSLGSVNLYTEAAKNKIKAQQHEEAFQILSKIAHISREVMIKMSDIVWGLNAKNDTTDQLFQRMNSYCAEVLPMANIAFNIQTQAGVEHISLDMVTRKTLYLIFKEAIYNAVKHAGCKSVFISCSIHNQQLQIRIADDGRGFDQRLLLTGNGLRNMKERALEMNGTLSVNTSAGAGTIIIIQAPILEL
jgi:signal transduction histidine kinase